MSKRAVVVLAGCGVYDGTEIHEAVVMLLALSRAGLVVQCTAPDIPQMHVINHLTGQPTDETRNVLVEAARIARGSIQPLSQISAEGYDALFFPGGFGAAKNLTTFATEGPGCSINPHVERIIQEFHAASKPICAVCISPAVIARAIGAQHPELTIGADPGTATAIEALGAAHHVCPVTHFHVDTHNRVVTAPAYMYDAPLAEIAEGIEKAVSATLALL